MSRVYDSWEKLVGAVLDREELRRIALCDSFSTISTDFSSRFSFANGRHQSLPWATRIKVALDVARGLLYLHDREIPVIHRDFKTANILLDGEFNAKLANYAYGTGARQLFATRGYTAPEAKDRLSTKSNVYSFGAILLELLSGISAPNLSWAEPYFSKKRKLLQIMDVRIDGQYSDDAAYKVAKLALKCLSLDPISRPCMTDVVVALEQLQRL